MKQCYFSALNNPMQKLYKIQHQLGLFMGLTAVFEEAFLELIWLLVPCDFFQALKGGVQTGFKYWNWPRAEQAVVELHSKRSATIQRLAVEMPADTY